MKRATAALALVMLGSALVPALAVSNVGWREPPDGVRTLKPNAVITLPNDASEIDIWTVKHGHANKRLVQRVDHSCLCRQWAFTLPRTKRPLAGYVGVNRDVFSFSRKPLRVYWWRENTD